MRALWLGLSMVVVALVWAVSVGPGEGRAQATVYYVATTGSDSNAGTLALPWRTIQHAADALQPGDTVYVRAGTYAEGVTLSTTGTAGSPIAFSVYAGEVVTLSGGGSEWAAFVVAQGVSYVSLNGFRLRDYGETGVDVRGSNSYVTLANLDVSGASSGVRVTWGYSGESPMYGPVDHLTLRDSRLHDNHFAGFDCTPGPCNDLVLQRLTIENNGVGVQSFGADGLAVERGYPLLVEDVVIRNNGGDGLDLNSRDRGPTPGVVVRRCVVTGNHFNGVKLWASARMENCLLYDMGLTPLVLGAFSNVAVEIVNNTVAYNMVNGRDYAARGWAVDVGSPGGDAEPTPTNVGLTLRNNIFAFNAYGDPDGQTGLYLGPGVVLTESNNLYYSREDGEIDAELVSGRDTWFTRAEVAGGTWTAWTGQGAGDVTVDPLFVNMVGGDFRLRSASPAIDAGTSQGAPAVDLLGLPRVGAPDIGAYEGSSSSPAPTATPTPTTTPTPRLTATPSATATRTPGSVGIGDPALVVTPAALPLQPVGTPFVDPVFRTTVRRVSSTSDGGGFETHIYSQLQAFSADNAYLLLTGSNGYVVRRTADLSLVSGLDTSGWNAPRWHPARPHVLVHYDDNADTTVRLWLTDLDTGVTSTAFTFPAQYQYILGNQSFDELSRDGRWLAGMVTRNDGARVIFALNLQSFAFGALLPIPDLYAGACAPDPVWGEIEPDWLAPSPLGNYLVVQWPRDGTARCSGLETFDIQTGAFVGRVYEGHQHGDLGIQPDGITEFFMTFELAGPPPYNGNPALAMRALPGTGTYSPPIFLQVLDWGNAEHISCRGPNGGCLVTAGVDPSNGWTHFEGEIFLQRTDGSVLRLAHHRSTSCGYWVQPRATISRDGRYVVFASDWGRGSGCDGDGLGRGDPYIVDLPDAPPPVPTATSTSSPTAPRTATASATRTATPTRTSTSTATAMPTGTPTQPGLAIRDVRASPNPFNPSRTGSTVRFDLSAPCASTVAVIVAMQNGDLVKFWLLGAQGAGPHTIQWDGRTGAGSLPGDGLYVLLVACVDQNGQSQAIGYDFVNVGSVVTDMTVSPRPYYPRLGDAALGFTLSSSGPALSKGVIVHLQGGLIREFPLRQSSSGVLTETWDGKDGAGNVVPDGRYLYGVMAVTANNPSIMHVGLVFFDVGSPQPYALSEPQARVQTSDVLKRGAEALDKSLKSLPR